MKSHSKTFPIFKHRPGQMRRQQTTRRSPWGEEESTTRYPTFESVHSSREPPLKGKRRQAKIEYIRGKNEKKSTPGETSCTTTLESTPGCQAGVLPREKRIHERDVLSGRAEKRGQGWTRSVRLRWFHREFPVKRSLLRKADNKKG